MNSKRIGIILAVLFLAGLSTVTIYSRSYAERRKPLVYIAFPQSGSFVWEFETASTIESAAEEFAALGLEWTIEVILPRSAWEDYMDEPPNLVTYVVSENHGHRERVEIARVITLDNGDSHIIYNYTAPDRVWRGDDMRNRVWPGENVRVFIEPNERFAVSDTLVPFSALHRCLATGAHYIFTITRRESAWGREYAASRHFVHLGRPARLGEMANLRGIPDNEPIVTWSERPLYHEAVVRIFD